MLHDGLVLQLSNFQCTIGARVRNIEFRTASANPGRMFDDSGRSIQYLGMLYMSWETTSTRALSNRVRRGTLNGSFCKSSWLVN